MTRSLKSWQWQGDNKLGENDFDQRIAEYFCSQHHLRFENLPLGSQVDLLKKAEQLKQQLLKENAAMMEWKKAGESLGLILTNELLIQISASLLKRMETAVKKIPILLDRK